MGSTAVPLENQIIRKKKLRAGKTTVFLSASHQPVTLSPLLVLIGHDLLHHGRFLFPHPNTKELP